jgi:hypothetical protein
VGKGGEKVVERMSVGGGGGGGGSGGSGGSGGNGDNGGDGVVKRWTPDMQMFVKKAYHVGSKYVGFIGPGFMVAVAYIDPGEWMVFFLWGWGYGGLSVGGHATLSGEGMQFAPHLQALFRRSLLGVELLLPRSTPFINTIREHQYYSRMKIKANTSSR